MKKGVQLLALFFLIAFSCPALAAWYFDSESVTVDLKVSAGLETSGPSSQLEYVTADVSLFPRDTESQSVISIDANPKPKSTDPTYLFRWDSPVPPDPGYEISARVKTKNVFHDVRKLSFPYVGFSDDIKEYTEPGKIIDSDDQKVIDKASELAAGESDYYKVVFRMADWTNENVKYDLSTLNAKASQKASYVLAKKDGVCDEITTLFIALLRSVGIPARFVSGIAYTNSEKFSQKWGPHGWAEVYFPGTGWVPFDVTYGEYGAVDPTHVKLKDSFDAAETDTKYEWLGHDVGVIADPIVLYADSVKYEGVVPDPLEIRTGVTQEVVGIGSYNVVEAEVKNRRNSYVSTILYISKINEMELEGRNSQGIVLAPLETRKFYWLVKAMDSLDSRYTYTFPITISDMRNTSAESDFRVVPGETVFSREEMQDVIDALVKQEEKVYSKKLDVNCSQAKEAYYVYDDPAIECRVRNTGNFPFKGLKFCFRDECQDADLAISQEKAFQYTQHSPKAGINKIPFTIEGTDVSRTFFYDLDVLDEPKLSVDDLAYPHQLEFGLPYTVEFTLKKEASNPQNITLKFDAAGNSRVVDAGDMLADKKFLFNLNSEDLSTKPNIFTISATYYDLNGRLYTEKEEFEIKLVNVTFGQKLVILLHDADRWIRNLFK
jgi:transglutaminase-like putative cysteine protease